MHVWLELLHFLCSDQQGSPAFGVSNRIILWSNCFNWFESLKRIVSPITNTR